MLKQIMISLALIASTLPAQAGPYFYGRASFYADEFHGRKTASGETFNMHEYTCASRSLPFGTFLKVTNLDNKKSVTVRVNDRGPFVKGRHLDLAKGAAKRIGITGVSRVRIEIIRFGR